MPHTPEDKKKALTRLRRIRGQCDALERALEAGSDCAPVLQQLAAIRGAVNGLMSEVMGMYVQEEFGSGQDLDAGKKQSIDTILSLVRTYLK
ncbi:MULTISPECIES: metal-sensing transcriptional repressor [Acetobacter]|jgi:DNA-binding FrmR family transcriptional regulator|uniref:DNA-binding FrmR family transcriptional regulator n=1 Tax=Acetobacter lovaniensis TaxID=104100 RepID=A0A841QB80_9PROT|nr:metal-sensing transcriptional repressor [Acetobacter lovaniensis]MBB6455467.1 DNA-binding FrmR family transcriptional regulator [Acetobacter lovaniensis]MCI1697595.1 metal-sensing transcriptional repressor [Acetobacter lovaniensis]MCI1795349.1 metal-sensing transcriptional repressor [Acetobacter lovaniensis]MCP1238694.1 metal-sensing transcriptional repressor [Acetobacter lovaniensis]NHN79873.1 metal-sensing transcriptional repressor [Acetobacter lovaniensis]